ncbi:MAG: PspC domain-containing protein [Acidimicrobiales bacterium]|jgi:phage shock protein PspC (stress-responsive transcriptional regulator)
MDTGSATNSPRQLHRRPDQGMIAGVAAGIADYLGVDVVAVRLGLVFLAFAGGIVVPLYLAAWLLVPAAGAPSSIGEDAFHQWV